MPFSYRVFHARARTSIHFTTSRVRKEAYRAYQVCRINELPRIGLRIGLRIGPRVRIGAFDGAQMADAQHVTQAEFARQLGVDRAHVTRLKHAGRLVMHGRHVLVEESRRRIDATGGIRPDVAARHQQGRAGRRPAPAAEAQGAPDQPATPPVDARSVEDWRGLRVKSEARRMQAQADREEMERDRLAGSLIDREDAGRAMRDVGASVRAALENFADQVAPLVAPVSDLDEVHAILAEQCRNVLTHVAEVLRKEAPS